MNETRKNVITQDSFASLKNRDAPEQRRSPKESVMKNAAADLSQGSMGPDAEIFFDESLSHIPSVDLKEIQQLSRFLPVIVFIPRSTARNQFALRKITVAKPSNESSDTTSLFGVFENALDRFTIARAESVFAFGDVTIHFSAMEALRKGEPVVLTTMEFKMLKYLIQNAHRVISRDELLNEVWGYENYPCTRTVDNHILRLRQKLERDPSHPVHFLTIHGVGYKFLP